MAKQKLLNRAATCIVMEGQEVSMNASMRKVCAVVLVAVLATVSLTVNAQAQGTLTEREITTEKMVADAIVVRPLGLVATIFGIGFFIVSLPFSALGGNAGEAGKKLVVAPAKFTFARPLGEF